MTSGGKSRMRGITRLQTEQNTLQRHLHVIGLVKDAIFRFCDGEVEFLHLLCRCDALARQRLDIFWVGFSTSEEIKMALLGEIVSIAKRIRLI